MNDNNEPRWIGTALVIRCQRWACVAKPGAHYGDGSGVCQACGGSTYKVLATRASTNDNATGDGAAS